jgi:UTP--glucose-1-phosphate uridylyltransferase
MMPVLDKPTIQYVVEEAVEAGLEDILIITGRGKQSIERHFDKSYELKTELKAAGKEARLDRVKDISDLVDIHYIRQKNRSGLGDAVQYAQKHVGNEPFALLLGDTIIKNDRPCTAYLIKYAEQYEESTISLERVPWEDIPSYGVADVVDTDENQPSFLVSGFVEKPAQEDAPSNIAITGRYVLTSDIFGYLNEIEPGVGGELQLTDAIRKLSSVRGVVLKGDRYDIGNIPQWLQANIQMALKHDSGEMNRAVEELLRSELHE